MSTTPIYSLRVPEVCEALETSLNGLSNAEAEARLSLYGQNILSKHKKTPLWEKLLQEFVRPPALVLLIVGLAGLLQRELVLAFDYLEHHHSQHRFFLLA
jgi:Cation transport ATPase